MLGIGLILYFKSIDKPKSIETQGKVSPFHEGVFGESINCYYLFGYFSTQNLSYNPNNINGHLSKIRYCISCHNTVTHMREGLLATVDTNLL